MPADLYKLSQQRPLGLLRPELIRERAFVGGAWIETANSILVINPATGNEVGRIPNLGPNEASDAVAAAETAAAGWRALSAKERSAILRRWYEAVVRNKEDLALIITNEQGKPLAEARSEVLYAASFIEWFAEESKRGYGDVVPGHTSRSRIWVDKRPVGIVAAITPWNFPAAMVTRKVAPALAAGCTVVLKPSEITPFTAIALAILAEEAGLPAGTLNIVTGAPAPIGDVLVSDPRIAKFTFTGSTAVGKQLAARCMLTSKRVSLELGGNAPFIVFDDADIESAVSGAIASKFRNAGQTCVCANRFLVQEGIYKDFADQLAKRVRELRVGNGLDPDIDQGPLIDSRATAKVEAHIRDALSGGATLMAGGSSHELGPNFFQPTVLVDVNSDALPWREETFGPVAALTPFRSERDAVELANKSRSGLASYVYTSNFDRAIRMTEALDFGMVGLNTGLVSTEVAPFGGCKESGIGREGSHYGLAEFQELKTVIAEVRS